jgi:hypothetical protein
MPALSTNQTGSDVASWFFLLKLLDEKPSWFFLLKLLDEKPSWLFHLMLLDEKPYSKSEYLH